MAEESLEPDSQITDEDNFIEETYDDIDGMFIDAGEEYEVHIQQSTRFGLCFRYNCIANSASSLLSREGLASHNPQFDSEDLEIIEKKLSIAKSEVSFSVEEHKLKFFTRVLEKFFCDAIIDQNLQTFPRETLEELFKDVFIDFADQLVRKINS